MCKTFARPNCNLTVADRRSSARAAAAGADDETSSDAARRFIAELLQQLISYANILPDLNRQTHKLPRAAEILQSINDVHNLSYTNGFQPLQDLLKQLKALTRGRADHLSNIFSHDRELRPMINLELRA